VEELLCSTHFPTPPPPPEPPEPLPSDLQYDNFLRNRFTDFNETLQGRVWGQDAVLLLYEVVIGRKFKKWRQIKMCKYGKINYISQNMAEKHSITIGDL
jgi:hypothetical protein